MLPPAKNPVLIGLRALSVVALIIAASACEADTSGRAGLVDLRYQISVVDRDGKAVPYATIWSAVRTADEPQISEASMQRSIARFRDDGDYSYFDSVPAPEAMVYRTDAKGKRSILFDNASQPPEGPFTITVAIQRRGFLPQVRSMSVDEMANKPLDFRFILVRDQRASTNPALEQFDTIRGRINDAWETASPKDKLALMKPLQEEARKLAESLVADGKTDDAAVVYFGLAHLPSIDSENDDDGQTRVTGYTSGFDSASERNVEDLETAIRLGSGRPYLSYLAVARPLNSQGVHLSPPELRRAYVAYAQSAIAKGDPGFWPGAFISLWQAQAAEGDFPGACRTLNKFKEFEPEQFPAQTWLELLEDLDREAKSAGFQGPACTYW